MPIKTFVNCLGVFEVGKKVKRKKAKLWNPDKSGWFFKFDDKCGGRYYMVGK
ncbi:MAG: hypothetical protein ACYSYU_01345 [Planctomycetota bacterium]|jgi:hypothetical protein